MEKCATCGIPAQNKKCPHFEKDQLGNLRRTEVPMEVTSTVRHR